MNGPLSVKLLFSSNLRTQCISFLKQGSVICNVMVGFNFWQVQSEYRALNADQWRHFYRFCKEVSHCNFLYFLHKF